MVIFRCLHKSYHLVRIYTPFLASSLPYKPPPNGDNPTYPGFWEQEDCIDLHIIYGYSPEG